MRPSPASALQQTRNTQPQQASPPGAQRARGPGCRERAGARAGTISQACQWQGTEHHTTGSAREQAGVRPSAPATEQHPTSDAAYHGRASGGVNGARPASQWGTLTAVGSVEIPVGQRELQAGQMAVHVKELLHMHGAVTKQCGSTRHGVDGTCMEHSVARLAHFSVSFSSHEITCQAWQHRCRP